MTVCQFLVRKEETALIEWTITVVRVLEVSTAPEIRQIEEIDKRQIVLFMLLFSLSVWNRFVLRKNMLCSFKNISIYNAFTID